MVARHALLGALLAGIGNVANADPPVVCGKTCYFNLMEQPASLNQDTLVKNFAASTYPTGLNFATSGSSTVYQDAYASVTLSWLSKNGQTVFDEILITCKFEEEMADKPVAMDINGMCRKEDPTQGYSLPPNHQVRAVVKCPKVAGSSLDYKTYGLGAQCQSLQAPEGMWLNFTVQDNVPESATGECVTPPRTLSPTNSPTTLSPTNSPTTLSPTNSPTTLSPTNSPTTLSPTNSPTTLSPTNSPTTLSPTRTPTLPPWSSACTILADPMLNNFLGRDVDLAPCKDFAMLRRLYHGSKIRVWTNITNAPDSTSQYVTSVDVYQEGKGLKTISAKDTPAYQVTQVDDYNDGTITLQLTQKSVTGFKYFDIDLYLEAPGTSREQSVIDTHQDGASGDCFNTAGTCEVPQVG